MGSTEIERRPAAEALVTQDHRLNWSDKQIALIAKTVAQGATGEELHFFLQVAARYNLDPFQGEIYCSKMRGRNGSEGRIAIIVGEQGRLKIANRYDDYRGFRSDVVCENDRFLKLPDPKEVPGVPDGWTYVEHSYKFGGEGENNGRGKIVGGWCEVYRAGRPPTFFYAPLSEYMPDPEKVSEGARAFIPWFKTESRMIVKCANSTAFRMAFNLASIYGEEEIEHVRKQEPEGTPSVEDEIEWGAEEDVADRMRSLFAAANNAKPNSYPAAKIRLMLAGISDEQRIDLAAKELIPFIHGHGGSVPEAGEVVVDESDISYDEVPEPVGDPESEPVNGDGEGDESQEDRLPGL